MNCKHICGECKYHKHICNRDYGFMGYSREEWICDNKESDAYYVLFTFKSEAEFPAELDRITKITDGVLRSMIIKKEA